MKLSRRENSALTAIDLVVLLGLAAVLACLFLPALASTGSSRRMNCVSNLKQIGIAFHLWAQDHADQLPWEVSSNGGGTLEFAGTDVVRHFAVASNELNSPKILWCYADRDRTRASLWTNFARTNLSYFVALQSGVGGILSGDRFFSTNNHLLSGNATISQPKGLRWAFGSHERNGSLLFRDSSVRIVKSKDLRNAITNFPVRILFP